MDAPNAPLIITKVEGATRQTEAPIDAFCRGDFDIAITLPVAAERIIHRDGTHLWPYSPPPHTGPFCLQRRLRLGWRGLRLLSAQGVLEPIGRGLGIPYLYSVGTAPALPL